MFFPKEALAGLFLCQCRLLNTFQWRCLMVLKYLKTYKYGSKMNRCFVIMNEWANQYVQNAENPLKKMLALDIQHLKYQN